MPTYEETNWKYSKGFRIRKYDLCIKTINALTTTQEQTARIEKISLVAFLGKEQKKSLLNICRVLRKMIEIFIRIIIFM